MDKLCKDNVMCCDDNCKRCANLVYEAYLKLKKEKAIVTDNEKVKVEIVNGCEGKSIYIDDIRVAGSKPWGGGYTEKMWMVDKKNILKAFGIKIEDIKQEF